MYKGVDQEFEFHHRSLWDWIVKQVEDPKLAPYFHWDAQRLWKYDGSKWERIYEEPWAADLFWEVQVSETAKRESDIELTQCVGFRPIFA